MIDVKPAICVFCAGALVVYQQEKPTNPQFHSSVDLVHVEVTVLDNARRPVTGLSVDDFLVRVDGRSRPISVFEEVRVGTALPKNVRPPTDLTTNVLAAERRLVLLLLDNSVEGLWPIKRSKEIAHQFVDQLAADDLGAVVFTTGSTDGQVFTADRARLRAAIDRLRPRVSRAEPAFLKTLSNVVEILAEAPERRRIIVAVAAGVPLDLAQLASPTVMGSSTSAKAEMIQQHQTLQSIFTVAKRANVNIYTVDPYGLYVGPGGGDARRLQREFLQAVAGNTGARAIVNTNSFDAGVAAIMAENSSYYLLGFENSPGLRDRRLEIVVNRGDVSVRTQSVVAAPPSAQGTRALDERFESLLPHDAIPLALWASPLPSEANKEATVAIVVKAAFPSTSARELECRVNAYDLHGRRQGTAVQRWRSSQSTTEVLLEMVLKPGRYQLRAVVSDTSDDRYASVYADLEVPDVSKEALWVSPVILKIGRIDTRSVTSRITAKREFQQSESLTAELHVGAKRWTGIEPLSAYFIILDKAGNTIVREQKRLEDGLGGRIRTVVAPIDVSGLVSGEYTIAFMVSGHGLEQTRSMPLTIKSPGVVPARLSPVASSQLGSLMPPRLPAPRSRPRRRRAGAPRGGRARRAPAGRRAPARA